MASSPRRLAQMLGLVLLAAGLAGCATTKAGNDPAGAKLAYADDTQQAGTKTFFTPRSLGGLAGRTVVVNSVADLKLRSHEIALTFDDGPMPGKTRAVLDALDKAGVKATFMMVGQMARSYPGLVREVASRGHTIGTHTQNHANLARMSMASAEAEIDGGFKSVRAALVPTRYSVAPFFRFPYLASTPALRRALAAHGITAIDADIDSKDYFQSSPDQVRQRTLSRVLARGSGIVLMHDIHPRTARMLPALLADLQERGYKVVRLVPGGSAGNLLVSSLSHRISVAYSAPVKIASN